MLMAESRVAGCHGLNSLSSLTLHICTQSEAIVALMDQFQLLCAALITFITGLALVSHIINEGIDVMNACIILVLRAVGRLFDVRRGEDEYSWPRRCHAAVSDHSSFPENRLLS
jgi:hypothetical protein